jgi:hypothetical protein
MTLSHRSSSRHAVNRLDTWRSLQCWDSAVHGALSRLSSVPVRFSFDVVRTFPPPPKAPARLAEAPSGREGGRSASMESVTLKCSAEQALIRQKSNAGAALHGCEKRSRLAIKMQRARCARQ